MAKEIERKFLITREEWRKSVFSVKNILQGYICDDPNHIVRIRIIDSEAWLTVKSRTVGISRSEYEFSIPVSRANDLLKDFCQERQIIKTRSKVKYSGFTWEIDEFSGALQGLVLAEIELPSEDTIFKIPVWIGSEVSNDSRYFNSNLIRVTSLTELI